MIHPHTELAHASDAIGAGVFVTHFIPRGTIVWVQDLDDTIYTPSEYAALCGRELAIVEKYAFVDSFGDYVLCGDIARYMNHSCEPATLSLGEYYEIAVRDLHPGDELTCEYGFLNLDQPMRCRCGSPSCRQWIRPEDPARYGADWEAQLREVLPELSRVHQPMWAMVQDLGEESTLLEAIRRGEPDLLLGVKRLRDGRLTG